MCVSAAGSAKFSSWWGSKRGTKNTENCRFVGTESGRGKTNTLQMQRKQKFAGVLEGAWILERRQKVVILWFHLRSLHFFVDGLSEIGYRVRNLIFQSTCTFSKKKNSYLNPFHMWPWLSACIFKWFYMLLSKSSLYWPTLTGFFVRSIHLGTFHISCKYWPYVAQLASTTTHRPMVTSSIPDKGTLTSPWSAVVLGLRPTSWWCRGFSTFYLSCQYSSNRPIMTVATLLRRK